MLCTEGFILSRRGPPGVTVRGALLLNVLPRWAIVPIAQRLWLRLTRQGKDVCSGHLAALRAIVGSPGPTL